VIFQSPVNGTPVGHQIVVLPNGTLVDVFTEFQFGATITTSLEILRSIDGGLTWSAPIVAAQEMPSGEIDPFNRSAVRTGATIPEVAVDPASGNVYAVWEDGRFSPPSPDGRNGEFDSIAFSMSLDGGLTWSSPIQINQTPVNLSAPLDSQAFTPSIAVGGDGTVAVTYYDFRYQGSIAGVATDCWAVFGNPQGSGGLTNPAKWGNELRLTSASFNILNGPVAEGPFLGDYQGLTAAGSNFLAFFAQAGSPFPQASTFSRQLLVGPPGPPAPAPASTPAPTVVSLPPSASPPPTGFLTPASYPVDQAPDAVAVGDFTNNGITDLVVANSASSTVSVLLGNGDGTFRAAQSYAVGASPVAVAVGDFDGDGTFDIVTANSALTAFAAGGTVSVLLGNGDGTFKKAQTFALPNVILNQAQQAPLAVALGDVDHDGTLDLVITAAVNFFGGRKGFVDVLLGQGDGTFRVGSITPINSDLRADFGPIGIALADFNGDGNLDLATANPTDDASVPGGSGISVLLGNGDGTFQETSDPNVGATVITSVAVGDLNHDHVPDLVVNGVAVIGGTSQSVVSVLLGRGNGTFQAPQLLNAGAAAVALGDFNRDGNLDIATPNLVFQGNGDGTFQAPLSFASGTNNPTALAVADFNRDGFPDLAVTDSNSNTVQVLINSATWPATAAVATALTSSVTPVTLLTSTSSPNPLDSPRAQAEIQRSVERLPSAAAVYRFFATGAWADQKIALLRSKPQAPAWWNELARGEGLLRDGP
jgi:hypothetical protein